MIYLQNTEKPQVVFVPRNGAYSQDDLVFKAKSTIDLEVEITCPVTDLHTSELYYNLALTLSEGIPTGEYEYSLMSGEMLLSSGILVVGEGTSPRQYEKEITYEQYESE